MGKPVPEREAAKATGERFYNTGRPCKNGHLSVRYTKNGCCKICIIANVTKSAAKAPWHPQRQAAKDAHQPRYNTSRPCMNGHSSDRYTSNGFCVTCDAVKGKRYHARHPGLGAKWARERRAEDPTGHRKASRKWAKQNPSKANAIRKRCVERNPGLWRKRYVVYVQNRKTRIAQNGGSFTVADIDALTAKQNGLCAACQRQRVLQVDHIIAIANGGSSDPSNLQLLCGPCNKSKGRKDMGAWLREHNFSL